MQEFFYFPFNFCHYTTILFYNFMHMLQLLFLLFKNAEGIVGKSVELYGWGDVEKKLEVKSCFVSHFCRGRCGLFLCGLMVRQNASTGSQTGDFVLKRKILP
ncbi:hypothetical protein DWX31_18815 [Hungatella hathewayi]|uniref:Uncharacterized protein n=1 Tax=Hungatella hathewayi TaxID=154046 RepID=A0A3E3DIW2_9FIRM|nr:hypothetical protein DWX31_18815 [Hungatella hathewayi]